MRCHRTRLLVALPFVAMVTACLLTRPASPVAGTVPLPTGTNLVELVAELQVTDQGAPTPYDRDQFGQRWADVDHNGCDQRNDALAAAMTTITYRPGTRDCVVETGTLIDAYTGQTIEFIKTRTGGGVQIDHLIPLAHAWQAGAWAWTPAQREEFANTLTQLQPVAAEINQAKSDQDITQWLPPGPAYVCTYAERWASIKAQWHLSVTTAERDRLTSLATQCEPTPTNETSNP
jgi:Protein of unknown function (DUF1524)